ncbi:hypothetical protein P7K49_029434 [Saguinus oedipus]|uniref:Uncharacterized protein n=1 Tax=Saguinus oedipus TaxID=9490 RepID=A0ABQ9U829_SAGOE|nr:hypothetical protein P7K49_029434 [Saguinus oedipus]
MLEHGAGPAQCPGPVLVLSSTVVALHSALGLSSSSAVLWWPCTVPWAFPRPQQYCGGPARCPGPVLVLSSTVVALHGALGLSSSSAVKEHCPLSGDAWPARDTLQRAGSLFREPQSSIGMRQPVWL